MTPEQHQRGGIDEYPICVGCCDDWPCDFIQGLRAGLEAAKAHAQEGIGLFSSEKTYCEQISRDVLLDFSDWIDQQLKEAP